MRISRQFIAVLATMFLYAAQAGAAPLVDGDVWTVSSEEEKEAYLIGAGNFMTVERIVQSKADIAPTDEQSSISSWYTALEATTINELVAAVDAWYTANPGSLETPVLVVIWNSFVETD